MRNFVNISHLRIMNRYFNTYYENIDTHFWHKLCVEKGVLRQYDKGELFTEEGMTAKYLGYIKSGSLKYIVYSPDGTDKAVDSVKSARRRLFD